MTAKPSSPKEYIDNLPSDRKSVVRKLRSTLRKHLPKGFKEEMNYNMLGYVVPHSVYPPGYHCDTSQPLPFINLASQKNYVALYHMGLYADKKLLDWFTKNYAANVTGKLDMGKSCIRFKNMNNIPYDLIGELAEKMSPQDWIKLYEKSRSSK